MNMIYDDDNIHDWLEKTAISRKLQRSALKETIRRRHARPDNWSDILKAYDTTPYAASTRSGRMRRIMGQRERRLRQQRVFSGERDPGRGLGKDYPISGAREARETERALGITKKSSVYSDDNIHEAIEKTAAKLTRTELGLIEKYIASKGVKRVKPGTAHGTLADRFGRQQGMGGRIRTKSGDWRSLQPKVKVAAAAAQVRSHVRKDGSRVKGHSRRKKEQSDAMLEQGALAGLGGIIGGTTALGTYGALFGQGMDQSTLHLGGSGRQQLQKAMQVERPIEFREKFRGQPGVYTPPLKDVPSMAKKDPLGTVIGDTGRVWTDPKSTIAAHELGHARVRDVRIGRALAKLRMAMPLTAMGGVGAALAADPDSKLSKYAPAIGGVGAGAMLTDEALATILGDKGLRKLEHGAPSARKEVIRGYRKAMLKGFGSYGLLAAAVMGTPYMIRQAKLKQRAKEVRRRR